MKMRICINLLIGGLVLFEFFACQKSVTDIDVLPSPHEVTSTITSSDFSKGLKLQFSEGNYNKLFELIREDIDRITNGKVKVVPTGNLLQLKIDKKLPADAYRLISDGNVEIEAGSHTALMNGLSTFYQLLDEKGRVPNVEIRDEPQFNYRSLMIDCARSFHDLDNLKTIIRLCQFYKVNYLHLHLTDDQLFTFPSTVFPKLISDQHYTKADLEFLNDFAFDRGVILVPEIDMPGHASPFIRKMPEIFGIDEPKLNPYTISIGSEKAYAAIEILISEVAAIFTHSPFIHIGGDEAFFENMDTDATTLTYMQKYSIPNIEELFRHFLVRVNAMVKSNGKQMIIWAGFKPKGKIEIPKDVIVILWEPQYYDARQLQKDGFPFINASFKPLYVVNNRTWEPMYILEQWNPRRWESWASKRNTFSGVEVPSNERLMGATMCAWEQNEINELPRLRKRIPAMIQNLWNEGHTSDYVKSIGSVDQKLSQFIRPFELSASGLKNTAKAEGNFYDHLEFAEKVKIQTIAFREDISIRYNRESRRCTAMDAELPNPLLITEDTRLDIQAFDQKGNEVGTPLKTRYLYKPITAIKSNLEKELPPNSWEKMRYKDSLTIKLSSSNKALGIKYSIDGDAINAKSPTYSKPIVIKGGIQTLRAQHFDSTSHEKVGSALSETYYDIVAIPSLTTGKKCWASNSHLRSDVTEYVNDGRITLWEQWGDHLDGNNWVQVDLGEKMEIKKLLVVNFWDNYRYYQYTISGSLDGEKWSELVDYSENTKLSTARGYHHEIDPVEVRFLKIHLTYNSANPGLHLVEFGAF